MDDLKIRLNALSAATEIARARSENVTADISKSEATRLERFTLSDEPDYRYGVVFAFLWFGALAASIIYSSITLSRVANLIRSTPEYRCMAAASTREPTLYWAGFRRLRADNSEFNGYVVGTLIDKLETNCIENGDAVSFAMLPLGSGPDLSLTRIEGRKVQVVQREWGQWLDITNEAGTERWRNDGDGYRKISL